MAAAVLTARVAVAQQEFTPADIEEGGRLFLVNCAQCHGAEGDAVPGVDLGHGQFRRATTDADLARIIRTGIPGTAMPPNSFSEETAGAIVAYMRSLDVGSASVPGDPVRGKALFDGKGMCLACHRVNGSGSRLGPDLSDVGVFRRASDLQRSLLEPGAEIRPQNRFIRVAARDGSTFTGRLLNHDTFALLLLDSNEQLRSFRKADLRQWSFDERSSMPSARGALSSEELTDMVRYLTSLKGTRSNTP